MQRTFVRFLSRNRSVVQVSWNDGKVNEDFGENVVLTSVVGLAGRSSAF
jgi:hypothetical protein